MPDATPIDKLMRKIADEYDDLSRQLKVIAQYVEKHRARLMLERLSEIAAACAVQPSVIVRFAQRFGYAGCAEIQNVFRHACNEQASATPDYQQRIRSLIATRDRQIVVCALTREFIGASQADLDELSAGRDDPRRAAAVALLHKGENIDVIGGPQGRESAGHHQQHAGAAGPRAVDRHRRKRVRIPLAHQLGLAGSLSDLSAMPSQVPPHRIHF